MAIFERACQNVRRELVDRGLQPHHRILDVGCGIGNLPLGLADYLHGGYDGLDINSEAVKWCQREITPRYPSFRFHLADVVSGAYNASGRHDAATYQFPFPSAVFDVVFLGSVFTHMFPDDVTQYIKEIDRVLTPEGWVCASFFLLNDETRASVDANRSFISFDVRHPSGLCRLHDAAIPEAAIAFEESFVLEICNRAGLRVRSIRRGKWSQGTIHDQDVMTLCRS